MWGTDWAPSTSIKCAVFVGDFGDAFDVVYDAADVADMAEAGDFGFIGEFAFEVFVVQCAVGVDVGVFDGEAPEFRNDFPGHDVAVVLHKREEDFVAWPKLL